MGAIPKGTEIPKAPSKYTKFEEGANKVRIMSEVVTGWEWWVADGKDKKKPVRVETQEEIPQDLRVDSKDAPRNFWAMVVYNYDLKDLQIMQITQKSIMNALMDLENNEDWGDIREFDVTITKKKTGSDAMNVEYSTTPSPKKEMDEGIVKYYEDMDINLKALFDGTDPWGLDIDIDSVDDILDE